MIMRKAIFRQRSGVKNLFEVADCSPFVRVTHDRHILQTLHRSGLITRSLTSLQKTEMGTKEHGQAASHKENQERSTRFVFSSS
jgi:hypothetical protein